jgi:hypothetical protein
VMCLLSGTGCGIVALLLCVCALRDYEPFAGVIASSLFKNFVIECSHSVSQC